MTHANKRVCVCVRACMCVELPRLCPNLDSEELKDCYSWIQMLVLPFPSCVSISNFLPVLKSWVSMQYTNLLWDFFEGYWLMDKNECQQPSKSSTQCGRYCRLAHSAPLLPLCHLFYQIPQTKMFKETFPDSLPVLVPQVISFLPSRCIWIRFGWQNTEVELLLLLLLLLPITIMKAYDCSPASVIAISASRP